MLRDAVAEKNALLSKVSSLQTMLQDAVLRAEAAEAEAKESAAACTATLTKRPREDAGGAAASKGNRRDSWRAC